MTYFLRLKFTERSVIRVITGIKCLSIPDQKFSISLNYLPFHSCYWNMERSYFSGTSGLLLPYRNKSFYPAKWQNKSRLSVYSLLFNSLEVNSSFYKMPRMETVRRWSEETEEGFKFTFKLWRGITHQKELTFEMTDVTKFLNIISAAGDKKGCLLIQLPPSIQFASFINLEKLLYCIAANGQSEGWQISVEFRDSSWYRQETLELLQSYKMNLVLHDKDGKGLNRFDSNMDVIYIHFHGPNGDYRESYEDALLYEYSLYINEYLAKGKTVYTYFNNTIGSAIANLKTLEGYIRKNSIYHI